MKTKIFYKKRWNKDGIEVSYEEGKEIKISLSEEEYMKNLVEATMRNIDPAKLTWAFKKGTISSIVSKAVENGFWEVTKDVKTDTWTRLA